MTKSLGRVVIVLFVVGFLSSSSAFAQTAKDLVGAWTPVSNVAEQSGVKSEPYGPNPRGILIFDAGGNYSLTLTRPGLPKCEAKSRMQGTAEENKAVVEGSITHFGRYSVDAAGKTILFSRSGDRG